MPALDGERFERVTAATRGGPGESFSAKRETLGIMGLSGCRHRSAPTRPGQVAEEPQRRLDTDVTRISLLSRVRSGLDQAAWSEFENRYRDLIVRYCLARGVQHADAEDICQIVMMSLAKALRGFHYSAERGRFRDYLGRVVRNAVARFRSRPNSIPISLDNSVDQADEPVGAYQADPLWEQEWIDHHYRLALRTVRETFDHKSVEIFEQLVNGKTVGDLARTYATTEQAVHKVKQRIRARMAELIAAQVREEDEPDEPRQV